MTAFLLCSITGSPGLQVIMEDFVQSQENLEADLRYFRAGGQEGEATSAGTVLCCCWQALQAQDSAQPPVLSLADAAACTRCPGATGCYYWQVWLLTQGFARALMLLLAQQLIQLCEGQPAGYPCATTTPLCSAQLVTRAG